jgi:peptide/nickel transport system substrate-binding protein
MVIDDPGIAGIAFAIAAQWSQLGFTVELDMVDYPTLLTRLDEGQFDVALVEFNLAPQADPDQFSLWHESQIENGQNFGGMKINRISYLLAQARRDHNGLHRKQYYDDFQRTFTASAPAIVLYNPLFVYATDPRVQGIQLDFISTSSDRFRTIEEWTFAQ